MEESAAAPARPGTVGVAAASIAFPVLTIGALLLAVAATTLSTDPSTFAETDMTLRWESLSCTLDDLLHVPYAWGVTSLLRNAPNLLLQLRGAPAITAAIAAIAAYGVRAAADAYFVPVDDCSLLTDSESGLSLTSLASPAAVGCARGTSLMALIFLDRFRLGMYIDEIVHGMHEFYLGEVGPSRWLLLRSLKLGVAVSCPGEVRSYFIMMHLESAWKWVEERFALA